MKDTTKKKKTEDMKDRIVKEVGSRLIKRIEKQIARDVKSLKTFPPPTESAWIDHYLLIDFGWAGDYFIPNSIQFYSSTDFLCSKSVDNTSLVSLIPILNCKYVHVMWDPATKKAVHIYGWQSKS